jgi:hypothetical protein
MLVGAAARPSGYHVRGCILLTWLTGRNVGGGSCTPGWRGGRSDRCRRGKAVQNFSFDHSRRSMGMSCCDPRNVGRDASGSGHRSRKINASLAPGNARAGLFEGAFTEEVFQ